MTPDPIRATCRRSFYPAAHTSGRRPLSAIRLVVMHSTEGGTAISVARYFHDPPDDDVGSAHLVVDDDRCERCLPDSAIPWAAPEANRVGFHIEQCGFADWTRAEWLAHRRELERGAWKAARALERFGIPATFLDAPKLRAGRSGLTTHAQCTLAFGPAGGHHDPGAGWPRDVFMRLVRGYL